MFGASNSPYSPHGDFSISTSTQPSIKQLVLKLIAESKRWEEHWKLTSKILQEQRQYLAIQHPENSDPENSNENPEANIQYKAIHQSENSKQKFCTENPDIHRVTNAVPKSKNQISISNNPTPDSIGNQNSAIGDEDKNLYLQLQLPAIYEDDLSYSDDQSIAVSIEMARMEATKDLEPSSDKDLHRETTALTGQETTPIEGDDWVQSGGDRSSSNDVEVDVLATRKGESQAGRIAPRYYVVAAGTRCGAAGHLATGRRANVSSSSSVGVFAPIMAKPPPLLAVVFPWNRTEETPVLKLIEEEDDAGGDGKLKRRRP